MALTSASRASVNALNQRIYTSSLFISYIATKIISLYVLKRSRSVCGVCLRLVSGAHKNMEDEWR